MAREPNVAPVAMNFALFLKQAAVTSAHPAGSIFASNTFVTTGVAHTSLPVLQTAGAVQGVTVVNELFTVTIGGSDAPPVPFPDTVPEIEHVERKWAS